MGATLTKRGKRSWLITVCVDGQRERKTIRGTADDAKRLVQHIHKQELAGINVVDAIRHARAQRAVSPSADVHYPRLRDALPEWIESEARQGEIRASTAVAYRSRLATWVYPHRLPDGRCLGELPVDQVTRDMLGQVIRRVREAGRSLAIIDALRNPLRSYYADLLERRALSGPNPAADLKHFVGRGAYRRIKARSLAFFTGEELPQLVATAKAVYPRWSAFILTGTLAGLRWGESAALYRTDIDFVRGRLHVQRTYSTKGRKIEPTKDSEARWVKASPALLTALRSHLDAVELEGQVEGWTPEQRQLVFPNTVGRVASHPHFLQHVWRPLLTKAGLPYRRFHATRHTFATLLLEDGTDARWVQNQLGHASIEQTVGTYGHVQPERHEAAVAALDRFLTV